MIIMVSSSFKVTAEMVEPFLEGTTLEEAMKNKKIYIVNLKKLTEIMCRFNRVVSGMYVKTIGTERPIS